MNKIIGIGNALVDVLVRLSDDEALANLGLSKGSMRLIDDEQEQHLEETMATLHPTRSTGGSAGNAMLALANLGVQPGFIGSIGRDDTGRFFRTNCEDTGIEARLIVCDGKSGVANTFITPDAERTFATYLGVAGKLSPSDITPEMLEGYQLVHVEGYLVQNHELIEKICRVAKAASMTVSIDLASYNVVSDNLQMLRDLVARYIDIVFANEEESAAFTSGKCPEEALREIASMADVAVVKVGKRGAVAMRNGQYVAVPGKSIGVVDTTAAGDFFAGGFLYAFTHGGSLEQCLQMGALLSQHIIQVVGTRLPKATWDEINHSAKIIMQNP